MSHASRAQSHFENAPKFGVELDVCKLQRKKLAENSWNKEPDVPSAGREHYSKTESTSRLNVHSNNEDKLEVLKKRKQSRWEFNQDEDTSQDNGKSKRRKSRWDDSENTSIKPSGFIDLLQLPMDPEMISLQTKLMKIEKKLQGSETLDERPPAARSPSPEPVYNNLGIRINTRDSRMRNKLMNERRRILSQVTNAKLTFKSPVSPKPGKHVEKLFVPTKEFPSYNFIGLILGPKGNTQKKMEKETGARIYIRGLGSGDEVSKNEDLHVRVEAESQSSLDAAVAMVKKLLVPLADQDNLHKKAQLAELAKLRGTYKDDNVCLLCKEEGHKKYACPLQDTTFTDISCSICGSVAHSTPDCGIATSTVISKTLLGFCGPEIGSEDKSSNGVDLANLYVCPLPLTMDDDRLRDLFLPFGRIIKITAVKDRSTGLCKGYGFVRFEDLSDAAAAMKHMNGYKLDGKTLAVRVAGQKSVPGSSYSDHFPAHSSQMVVPLPPLSNALAHTSCIYGPSVQMEPVAPFTNPNSGSLYSYSNFPGNDFTVARKESPNSTSNYDFCDKVVSSSHDLMMSTFPGAPDYPGSKFGSYFTSTMMNEG